MKQILLISLLFVIFGFVSCDDNSDDNINTFTGTPADVSNTLSEDDWKITYFYDSDHEETSNYTQYSFTFSDDGILTAVKQENTYSGTWSSDNDDSTVKLVISFSSPDDLEEISDDWHVIEKTDVTIKLEDVSGGNGGTDYLTFEKF